MDFDSADEYFSCSDSSVYGVNSKEVLNAVDYTLLELSQRKKANIQNQHMRSFLLEKKSITSADIMDDSTCHDVHSLRNRMRQVRFQLAIQKQLIDKERDSLLEKAEIRRIKDEHFISSHSAPTCFDSTTIQSSPCLRLQISVPQHFSEQQHRRQKAQGITAWDGSQYMLALLYSLGNKLLLKFCFLFLRDRAHLWTKQKAVVERMFASKCRLLVTASFAGLKVCWLQQRHDQTAKARGRRQHATHIQRVHLLQWRYICRQRKYYRRLADVATLSHQTCAIQRTWLFLHRQLFNYPQNRKKELCQQIKNTKIKNTKELFRQRRLFTVPRPRLETPDASQNNVWKGDRFSDNEDISHHYHCSRVRCRSMLVFLSRTSHLLHTQRALERGAHRHRMYLARRGFQAWRAFHQRCCWDIRAEKKIIFCKEIKRRRCLLKCFQQLCAVSKKEKEKRGVFEGLTPPPIIVQARTPEGTRRPPLAVSFLKEKETHEKTLIRNKLNQTFHSQDESTLSVDEGGDISMDSLDGEQIFASPQSEYQTRVHSHSHIKPPESSNDNIYDTTLNNTKNDDNINNGPMMSPAYTLANQVISPKNSSPRGHIKDKECNTENTNNDNNNNNDIDRHCKDYDDNDISNHFINDHTSERGKEEDEPPGPRQGETFSEVSSLATNDNESYLPTLRGVGTPSREQLPLSYHLYTSNPGSVLDKAMDSKRSDGSSQVITSPSSLECASNTGSDNDDGDDDMNVMQDSKLALPLSHRIFLQQKHQNTSGMSREDNNNNDRAVMLASSDAESHLDSKQGGDKQVIGLCRKARKHKPPCRLIAEVNRRYQQHSLKRFVSFFFKWKRQAQSSILLRRVFSHALTLWEGRYQRRYSSLPFHLLRHILNIWKFAVFLAQERRQDAHNVQRALVFRGISLLSKMFVKWSTWTRVMQKKNQQLESLEHMTKQVCFLGLVMLLQKLQVRFDLARRHYRTRCQRQVFNNLFEYAITSQERHEELRKCVDRMQLRHRWRSWVGEYKKTVLEVRTAAHISRRLSELRQTYWVAWRNKYALFQRHKLFAKNMEDAFIRNKAKRMFLRWPGRDVSIRASKLQRKHKRNRSRLLAIVQGQMVVPFSLRNKVIPPVLLHGAFNDKYNEDNDSISITSSISGVSDGGDGGGGSDEENVLDNSSSAAGVLREVRPTCASKMVLGNKSATSTKTNTRKEVTTTNINSSSSSNPHNSCRIQGEQSTASITPHLLLPPPPSYYMPPQYYTSSATPTLKTRGCGAKCDSSSHTHDHSTPLSIQTTQSRAVSLGYSNGRPEYKKLVRLFMQEIVTHWRIYAKKHKDIRRLGLFLQSCTKLRRLSKRFYHWLVRSSALAHRKSTWILPSQKQLPYYYKDTSSASALSTASLHQRRNGPPLRTQPQPQHSQSHSQSTASIVGKHKNNISMGYVPPSLAGSKGRNVSILTLLDPYSHQKELPGTGTGPGPDAIATSTSASATHVLYEQEQEMGEQWEESREELMDPYPLRTSVVSSSAATSTLASSSSSSFSSSTSQAEASYGISGKSFLQPKKMGPVEPLKKKATHDQVYEVGKFYLGHRNVQYSHVVSDQL